MGKGFGIGLGAALWLGHLAGGEAAAASPEILEFAGICDASAAVALDEQRVLVGDDEQRVLSVYNLASRQREATVALPAGGGEADLEGAAIFGDRIVWISSNGRNKNGKVKRDRFQLFASHYRTGDGSWHAKFSASFGGLPDAIAASSASDYQVIRAAVGDLDEDVAELAPKKRGFNVEGLTVTPDGAALLAGLRNPQQDGAALLCRLDHADVFLDGAGGEPVLGPVTQLELGGRGIRDIAWSPAHNAYLLAAGQVDDEDDAGPGFALFSWDGAGKPQEIAALADFLSATPDFHPEALVPLLKRDSDRLLPDRRVLVISDDGTERLAGGGECKAGADAEKSFRAVVLDLD